MKRVLKWLGVVVLLLAVALGAVWYTAFGVTSAIVDGPLAPGVEVVKDGFVSAFILDVGPGKVALVDAGKDDAGAAILARLTQRGLSRESVTAIFLTHGHGDHTAGCKQFPAAQVYALEDEIARVGDAAKVTHPIKDGDVATLGDLEVETFAVPGHTSGSAVFLSRGVLFFGDSAGASKKGAFLKAVRLFSTSSRENVASLKTLEARLLPRAAEVKTLAFAHSGSLVGFQPLVVFAAQAE